jgi:hypothetical protein
MSAKLSLSHRWRVLQDSMRIIESKREEVTGSWRRPHNERLNTVRILRNIISVMKSRRIWRTGHIAHIGREGKCVYKILVGRPENRPLGRHRYWWKDGEKWILKEQNLWVCIGLTLLRIWSSGEFLWSYDPSDSVEGGNFLISWATVSFSKRILLFWVLWLVYLPTKAFTFFALRLSKLNFPKYMIKAALIAQWYSAGLRAVWSEVRVLAETGNFSLLHRVQTGSVAHPASYPMGKRGSLPGGKAGGAWSWPLTSI